jgi:hypothetical protein
LYYSIYSTDTLFLFYIFFFFFKKKRGYEYFGGGGCLNVFLPPPPPFPPPPPWAGDPSQFESIYFCFFSVVRGGGRMHVQMAGVGKGTLIRVEINFRSLILCLCLYI